jgi:hypothetical protein
MKLKPYEHLVHLVLDMKPWVLSIPAQSKMIGIEGAEVQINLNDFEIDATDWEAILSNGKKLTVQLNHNFETLDIPVLDAKVSEWKQIKESKVIHLHLTFLESTLELSEFLTHI